MTVARPVINVPFAKRYARNPSARVVLEGIQNRITWKLYCAGVSARWRQWDSIEQLNQNRSLSIETLYENTCPHPLSDDPILQKSDIQASFPDIDKPLNEFVRKLRGPVTLEPTFGYAIAAPGRVVPESYTGMAFSRNSAMMHVNSGVPSLKAYNAHRKKKHHIRREPKLVTFRHHFEGNYYHCFIDTMSRLHLLDIARVDPTIPIVVAPPLANSKFFQEMITRGGLAKRRWIIQDEFLETDELIYTEMTGGIASRVDYLLDLMHVPQADPAKSRRVFLTRSEKSGRHLLNMGEIRPILDDYGFDVVDTDGLSLDDQIKLFQDVGYLIGLHGAGLTNMIFRRSAPLRLLEIYDPNDTPLFFYVLAKALGYEHDYIVGSDAENNTNLSPYRLNPETLRERLSSST